MSHLRAFTVKVVLWVIYYDARTRHTKSMRWFKDEEGKDSGRARVERNKQEAKKDCGTQGVLRVSLSGLTQALFTVKKLHSKEELLHTQGYREGS